MASGLEKSKIFTLKNGLQIICIESLKLPIVSFSIWYKCGARCDLLGKSGAAHYLEHMACSLNDGKFDAFLDEIGAYRNAMTGTSLVCFFEIFSKEHLETVFKNEAERLKTIKIDDKVFESERGAILEERNMRFDNSHSGRMLEVEWAHLFNRQLGGVSIIGWQREIENLKKEDLIDFHKEWFAPNNAVIIVIGDINFENIKMLTQKYFGDIKEKQISCKKPLNRRPDSFKVLNLKIPGSFSGVKIRYFYHVPFLGIKNFRKSLALELAINILNSPGNFINEIATDNQDPFNVNIEYTSAEFEYDYVVVDISGAGMNNLKEYNQIWEFIRNQILKTNITLKQLEEAKKHFTLNLAYESDDIWSLSMFLGCRLTCGFEFQDIVNLEKTTNLISVDECSKVLKEVFQNAPVCISTITPKGYVND